VPRGAALRQQTLPPAVPVGLPSALVERRPDLRQAEQTLVAANAQIGVAKAAYFPQITLTGAFGGVSTQLSDILKGNAFLWAIGGTLAGPIFTGGLLDAQYDATVAQWEQARLQYEQSVLNAFQEVSNLLVTRQKLEESRLHQQRAVDALSDSVRYATERYIGGLASYFEVLEAQQQLYPAQNQLAQIDGSRFVVIVQLYKALGGGWKREE
jgi:multidrug efflux system outer membrane protein